MTQPFSVDDAAEAFFNALEERFECGPHHTCWSPAVDLAPHEALATAGTGEASPQVILREL